MTTRLALAVGLWMTVTAPSTRITDSLIADLKPISREQFLEFRNLDPLIFPADTQVEEILEVDLPVARTVLNLMVDENWRSLDFFAHAFFNRDKRILFYPQQVLATIANEYEVPTIFLLKGTLRDRVQFEGKEYLRDTPFEMEALFLGQGRIVVVYPLPVKVHRDDASFGIATGNYDFCPINLINIDNTEKAFTLNQFRGRNSLQEPTRAIRGPFGFPIERITRNRDATKVDVSVGLFSLTFPNPLMKRL